MISSTHSYYLKNGVMMMNINLKKAESFKYRLM